jgi:beta-alanine degradation protein BauB
MTIGNAWRSLRWLTVPCLVLALGAAVAAVVAAQDAAQVSPNVVKVKFENDRVRVLEVISNPGDKEATHSHPASVAYVISGGKLRITLPDGKTTVAEIKAGDAAYREPVTHSAENIGTTQVHQIIVELKKP